MGNVHGYERKDYWGVLKNFRGIRDCDSLVPCFVIGDDILKVYDCFTFFNEFEILELRLKALWDVVDYFVIVEANIKQSGVPKDFNLLKRADDFKEFFPKIRYVAADLSKVPFKGTGDWSIENAQRNAIMSGIGDAAPDDFIFISDLDEIPAPNIFQRLQENQIELVAPVVVLAAKNIVCPARLLISAADFLESGAIVMTQKLLGYYFDWIDPQTWQGSILTKRKNSHDAPRVAQFEKSVAACSGGRLPLYLYGWSRPRDRKNDFGCRRQRGC